MSMTSDRYQSAGLHSAGRTNPLNTEQLQDKQVAP